MKRHFLLLQGVSSPFFKRLGETLVAQGHRVTKLSFNGGDVAYWAPHTSRWFRQDLSQLPHTLNQIYQNEAITDQVLFGDRRPVHQIAVTQALLVGIRNHVFEEGYFRPYWVTLEREGVNSRSHLPRDPDWIRAAALKLAAADTADIENYADSTISVNPEHQQFQSPFWRRAAHDVGYHLASSLNPFLFPRYKTHAPVLAPVEYAGFVARTLKNNRLEEQEHIKLSALLTQSGGYYFLPLQLNSDFQVQDQPVLNSMPVLLEHVIASFAHHAPLGTSLAIKNHPLDFGQINYQALSDQLAKQYGVSGRIHYFETGDLGKLVSQALGTITLNSTVGSVALELGCPTLCLAHALYNFPGLTAQCGLDDFWIQRPKPDMALFKQFKAVVMHTTQVNGGFYCPQGIALAVKASADRLTAEHSPLELLMQQTHS